MDTFLSCDWGTSAFRIRLVRLSTGEIIAEEKNDCGIKWFYNQWAPSGQERLKFYTSFLYEQIQKLKAKTVADFDNAIVVISGMASSTMGMKELPYKKLPFSVNGADVDFFTIDKDEVFPYTIFLVSGVQSDDDVMRGEETLLLGATEKAQEGLFIFPGTHSKHIEVREGRALSIATYMTGELFELLAKQSILSNSVQRNEEWNDHFQKCFCEGVINSKEKNILNTLFSVRTNGIFSKYSNEENYHYLSGLLIGAELIDIPAHNDEVILVAGDSLALVYKLAVETLHPKKRIIVQDAPTALVKGQAKIVQRHIHG